MTRLVFDQSSELASQFIPNKPDGLLDLTESTYEEFPGRDDRQLTDYDHFQDRYHCPTNTESNKACDFLAALHANTTVTSLVFPEISVDSEFGLTHIANAITRLMDANRSLKAIELKASYLEGNIYRTLTVKTAGDHINVYYGTHDNVADADFNEPAEQLQTSYRRAMHSHFLRSSRIERGESPFNPPGLVPLFAPTATTPRTPIKP
jgi:hypothetical protein